MLASDYKWTRDFVRLHAYNLEICNNVDLVACACYANKYAYRNKTRINSKTTLKILNVYMHNVGQLKSYF